MPEHTKNVTFEEAIRACELIDSYFLMPGLIQPSRTAALQARVSRRALQNLLSPLFGTPESELKRMAPTIVSEFRLRATKNASVKAGATRLKATLKAYAEGR
jgi:hypothetical protein